MTDYTVQKSVSGKIRDFERIDSAAKKAGMNRSEYMIEAALAKAEKE